jgi:predicted nucleic acid-binding protein
VTFLIDANVVVYAAADGPYREACLAILRAIAAGQADGRASTAVLEEVWHVELSGRAGDLRGLARASYELFTPLLPVGDGVFAAALALPESALGANDRIHAATCAQNEIAEIVTADADFDDAVAGLRRVDPLDRPAVERLLGGG